MMKPSYQRSSFGHFAGGALGAALLVLATGTFAAEDEIATGAPHGATVPDMILTLAAITGWVAADMGLPVTASLPGLNFIDPARMAVTLADERRKFGEVGTYQGTTQVLAFYNTRTRSLYLPQGWSGATPTELSILVHEVVHHLQAVHDQRFDCPAAREKQAYETQERWLALFGMDLETAVGIDPLTLLVSTNCMF